LYPPDKDGSKFCKVVALPIAFVPIPAKSVLKSIFNIFILWSLENFSTGSNNKFFVTHHPTSYPKKEQLISKSLKDVYKDLGQYLKSLT